MCGLGRTPGGGRCSIVLHRRRNALALQCQLSALALALRGGNIDRCFWGIGPSGVGQSLFTGHLTALLGSLHAYLDTNVYYSGEELRKQAEHLVGKPVVTGQEAPPASPLLYMWVWV